MLCQGHVLYINAYHWCPFKYTHTHSFQCFTESKIRNSVFFGSFGSGSSHHIDTEFQGADLQTRVSRCHHFWNRRLGKKKDQVLKEGFDPAYGARQGIVMSKLFGLSFCIYIYRLLMSQKNQQNDNVNETSVFFLANRFVEAFASCYHPDARGTHPNRNQLSRVVVSKRRAKGHFGWAALSTNRRWWGSSGWFQKKMFKLLIHFYSLKKFCFKSLLS